MKMLRVLGAFVLGLALLVAAVAPADAATVKITVNGEPITDIQISQRLALMKLERRSGQKLAIEELVNEALEIQEAKRLGFEVSEGDIDDAYLGVARQLKISASNLNKIMTDNGVAVQTLRDRLKATVAWGKVTSTVVSAKVTVSEADIDKEAKAKLTAANSFDYILKEVLFLMPGGEGSASKRTAEANRYKKSFSGCDSAVQLSLSYTDAAVRDIGRRHATQMPEAIADELSKLNVGGITKPRVVQGGVSMLAVCSKEVAEDTTFIAGDLRQSVGNGALKAEADKYLADLKAKAQIIYS
ncbi:MAG: peptidylprolyl isomerase [Devosia nanyangense]|uniref:Peptidylprolyl isomerase n=1 Tax=Devosia nanyangense TaxID=1228055 RepID=A0A933NVZ6_9HYPH|nr:peptidylprolyl isomerase [Devosia nanyangense]